MFLTSADAVAVPVEGQFWEESRVGPGGRVGQVEGLMAAAAPQGCVLGCPGLRPSSVEPEGCPRTQRGRWRL